MLNPYEEQQAWDWEVKEHELDFQNLVETYRYELHKVPVAEGLEEFFRESDVLYFKHLFHREGD